MNTTLNLRRLSARHLGLIAIGLIATATHARAFSSKVVIPAGTPVSLELIDDLSSETSHMGDVVRLRLREDVSIDGHKVLRAGTEASGAITVAHPRGRLARQGRLGFELDSLTNKGRRIEIRVARPEVASDAPRGRLLLSRIASPFKRVAHHVVATADLDRVDARATAVARQGETSVNGAATKALNQVDPLAALELGTDSRAGDAIKRGVRSLERVGTGYVVSILSGPAGLVRRGASVEVPAGTAVQAVIIEEITL